MKKLPIWFKALLLTIGTMGSIVLVGLFPPLGFVFIATCVYFVFYQIIER